MDEGAIIEVRGLTAAYGDEVILRDISFKVKRGEVFVILGGSGSGKSTLLKHLIGLYRLAAGEVLIDGEDLARADGAERQRILRRFGVAYQSGALFGSMTLSENVSLPIEEFTRLPFTAREVISWMKLKLVGLEGFGDHLPAEVSGGMKKRAAIARAMALDPAVLFLDEPSAGSGSGDIRGTRCPHTRASGRPRNDLCHCHPRVAQYLCAWRIASLCSTNANKELSPRDARRICAITRTESIRPQVLSQGG